MTKTVLGIIGGSGIYNLEMQDARWEKIDSPWGEPSDEIRKGTIDGLPVVFLPRHARGHKITPSDINYRANIDILKRAGVTDLISVSAVGSFREHIPPGTFVIIDQYIDRTFARHKSFFGKGCVAHVSLADPVSPLLADLIEQAAIAEKITHHKGGTLLVMEGPQFSTKAESHMYRAWGCDVIGMTSMPEAKLAREAEICYANIGMVTDFDSWHPEHGAIDISTLLKVMADNVGNAQSLVRRIAQDMPREHPACPIGSDKALEFAIVTQRPDRDPSLVHKLDSIAGRVL